MGKIFYIMGKSSSGKDSIYRALMEDGELGLIGVTKYTTRPMREGEANGREYFFISMNEMDKLDADGKIIERRRYNTVMGPWDYSLVDDGQIDLAKGNYLMVGILSAFVVMKEYFGGEAIVPLYVEVEDGERLLRAIKREQSGTPHYDEMCRRFLADCADFSDEKLAEAGVTRRYNNQDFDTCLEEIRTEIRRENL